MNRSLGCGICLTLASLLCGCEKSSVPPENSAAYQRAQRSAEARNFAAAAAAYRQSLDQYPRFARAHLELGLLADEKLGDPVTAIYHYRRCLELEPSADKRRVIEDYIERAQLALAAKLPKAEGVDTAELVRLQNQNAALMSELAALRTKVSELEAARQTTAPPPLVTNNVTLVPPVAVVVPVTNAGAVTEQPPRPAYHEVSKGDTLFSIALRYYGTRSAWEKIYRANQASLPNKDQLRIGQRLVLP